MTPLPQSPTVLIVDDEPAVRLILRTILEERFSVIACGCGSEAVKFASEHPGEVSAAFVDYAMPEMDGNAVCAALRQIDATISLIGFSAHENAPFSSPLFAQLFKRHLPPEHVLAAAVEAVRTAQQARGSGVALLRPNRD